MTFRHAPSLAGDGGGNSAFENPAPAAGRLAKAAAAPDSLKVRAAGFVTKSVAVASLDATVDIVLDSVPTGPGLKNPPGPSAGCGKTPTLASGSRTITVGGQSRGYMIRIPANYDRSHPYPLVFAFHWNGGSMNDVDGGGTSGYTWSYYGIREKADKSADAKMIFIAPNGISAGWQNTGNRDLNLVDELLKLAKGDLCVDTTRVFSMGFSYGGGMTYAIACARAKVFRAAAVYAGAELSGCSDGTQPIAYIGFHGLRDMTCRIAGGRTLRDRFVKNNGCPSQTAPEPAENSLKHVCTSYTGCNSAYPVRWCAFDGAGHSPAPVDGSTSDSGGGDKTWTKDEAWAFFTQF
jgi:poly(3-hydroxybutyrate) depolymerase